MGAAGSAAAAPSVTVCAATAEPPALSNVTWCVMVYAKVAVSLGAMPSQKALALMVMVWATSMASSSYSGLFSSGSLPSVV